ncbi:sugar transporter [Fistulina hepatica ATCC 64428]|uniref:Sugar transporter n=1 Tax=Fistulina hepatica ATCC 64428 TaxID=1128425 RepID=A0A0D7A6W8_9AGAR|nr:sugar transporter [Fistulina hepatica ATCC 64428]
MPLTFYNPYAIATTSVLGGFLFGTDITSVSAFLDVDSYLDYFHHPDDTTQGGITASMPAGAFIGALIAGPVSNRVGRKKSIIMSTAFWIVGCVLSCASQDVAMLIVSRIIKGVCVGWTSSQVPVYLAEQSPKAIRGRLVGAQQFAITIGILVMFYVSYGCSFLDGVGAFRLAWGLQIIPGAILGLMMPFLPESTRWLAGRDRFEEAEEIIARIHSLPVDSPEVQEEMEEIREAVRLERESAEIGYMDLFRPQLLSRTIAGVCIQMWSQMCGMNVMMYYIVYVFQMAGLTGNTNLISSSIQYVINFAMTIPAVMWVDKWGRRPTLLVGSALMAIFLFATAGLLASDGYYVAGGVDGNADIRWTINGAPSKGVIACSYLFVASYAITWGPVGWIYISEIFPRSVRAQGCGLATATNWIFNFALAFFVPPAFRNIQWKTYIIFAVFCVASFIQVFLTFHETKGRSLEEIGDLFEASIIAFGAQKKIARKHAIDDKKQDDSMSDHKGTTEKATP